jgi:hypothetical protein
MSKACSTSSWPVKLKSILSIWPSSRALKNGSPWINDQTFTTRYHEQQKRMLAYIQSPRVYRHKDMTQPRLTECMVWWNILA